MREVGDIAIKKKIDILTFWGVPNYGAFCQAYALNRYLNLRYSEYRVQHIGYLHPTHYKLYHEKREPKIHGLRDLISGKYFTAKRAWRKDPLIHYPHFESAWNSIPHTDFLSSTQLEEEAFDVLITGSDAIWEYSIKEFGDDEHLIGNHLLTNKLVAYAASFGNVDRNDSLPSFVREGLGKYDYLSVRDDTSMEIINEERKVMPNIKDVSLVLDPSLLHDFKTDSAIPKTHYKNYILVYGDDFPDRMIQEIKQYAAVHKLTVIGAGIAPYWCDMRLTEISPLDWIGMFRDAMFVVTCTFHGLMFSINFEKRILFNQVEYVKNRSTWLLEKLGLLSLFANDVTLEKCLNYEWSYSEINRKLDALRKSSEDFLKEVLDG